MVGTLRALAFASAILGAFADIPKCGPGSPCPAEAPCCSAYGQCGVGAYCLGGCDPLFSHSLNSCVPNPTCVSKTYAMNSLDGIQDIGKYLGDSSKADWVASGKPVVYNNQALLLTMAPDTVGTLLASTHYVWYGKISATLTTSQGKGVVTAFIMMSDVKDEIDFEWVGVDTEHVQTNYYSQGVTNYNNGGNISASATQSTTHTYTIDWTPDQISWIVDGKTLRTKKRSETWNSTANRYDFPQTPSRVMLSLWPAGLPSNAKGTVDWAGGLIDWNSQYMQNGYYYAMFKEVKVECYQPPAGASISGKKSYIYTDAAGTNDTVSTVDKQVILKSLTATGENPGNDTTKADSKTAPESIPGVSGAGGRSDDNGGGSSGSGNSTSGSTTGGSQGFTQGTGTTKSGGDRLQRLESGSVFAGLVALTAVLLL
ncbi:hypothetical protein EJ06DRAFT_187154 [Trichodelitschia bisporula]|uniref:Crh-like protein n=1 Tax=Trichodelitschia bisporula TaxID=703511 RepID=A0A6G1I6Z8_9PEZI|nr:hypothetical protein EJ06DRAFT_187154 [Trichodelitschia bisporula]